MLFLSVTTSLEIISAGSVLDRGGYESAYFLRRRRNSWTRNASAVPTTTSTMVTVLDELEGDGLRFSLR